MADGVFPSLVSKDRNDNAVGNPIFVQLSDGTAAINVSSGSLDVNITNASIAVTATDLDIRDLLHTQDSIQIWANTAKDGTGTDYIPLVDTDGHLQVDVLTLPSISIDYSYVDDSAFTVSTDKVGAIGMLADETAPDSVDEGDVGIPRMTLDRKQLMVITDPTTDSQRLGITAAGSAKVDIAEQSLTAVKVSKDANANTETNPIFVKNVDTVVSGEEIHDYDQGVAVGAGSTSNHDYTATNTFLLTSVIVSASGNAKFEIQNNGTTFAVGFLTGRQGDTKQLEFKPSVEVASGNVLRIIRTNRQLGAMDLYSTIIGNDV